MKKARSALCWHPFISHPTGLSCNSTFTRRRVHLTLSQRYIHLITISQELWYHDSLGNNNATVMKRMKAYFQHLWSRTEVGCIMSNSCSLRSHLLSAAAVPQGARVAGHQDQGPAHGHGAAEQRLRLRGVCLSGTAV